MKETEYIYFRESLAQAFLADLTTFGFMTLTVWLNYKFIGGSYFLNGVILVMFMLFIVGKVQSKGKRFTNAKDLKDFVDSQALQV